MQLRHFEARTIYDYTPSPGAEPIGWIRSWWIHIWTVAHLHTIR